MTSGKRIGIAGAFGFYNTGDDAILQSWLNHLRVAAPDAEVVVLGGAASTIKQQHRVEAIDWADWQGTIAAMPTIDLLLVGGGGLFHDYWAMTPDAFLMPPEVTGPSYYISLIYLAQLFGKPCVLSGVGVGPLQTARGREYTRYAFTGVRATLRDQGSLDCLQQAGILDPDIIITADPVFGLPISKIPLNQWQEWIGLVPQGPIFGISVRNWALGVDSEQWMNQLAAALDVVLEHTRGTAVFIPFQVNAGHSYTDDPASARRVRERMKCATQTHIINHYLQPDLAEAIVASCDLLVGMRLHSVVMALRRSVPIIALAYDPKVAQAMKEPGLSNYSFELGSLVAQDLNKAIEQALNNRESLSRGIRVFAQSQFDRSRKNVQLALEALSSAQPHALLPPHLQHWAINILKAHSRLERKQIDSRKLNEAEKEEHLAAIQRLQEDIDRRRRREQQLRANAVKIEQQLDEIQRTERELLRLKFSLKHPIGTAFRLLRRKGGSLSRQLIRRRHGRSDEPVTVNSQAVVKGEAASESDKTLPRRVCIVAPAFFDMEGKVPYLGGAERYLYELVRVVRGLGYEPEIYQPARGDWIRHFRDLEIRGLDTDGHIGEMNAVFHRRVPKPDLTIYLAFFLAAPKCFQPSIGISHGVYWDAEYFHHTPDRLRHAVDEVLDCFKNLRTIISVDTNTINWVRTVRPSLAEKFHYVPNFVDLSQFRPRPPDDKRSGDEVVILFPRRLYKARGFWLLTEVMHEILSRHPRAVFHFVGQAGDDREQEFMTSAVSEYPKRVRWDTLPPDQMHQAYWGADISLIPTVYAEGTSLSCLEAMASGNAVIATDVGGLPNLILDRYNGLLIRPTVDDLLASLDLLIQDKELRQQLAARAVETAQVFSLEAWKTKWVQPLGQYLPQQPASIVRKLRRPSRAVVVENPSLEWLRMKQRPHYLAEQFAACGWEVFWRQPLKDSKSSLPHLHFISNDELLFGDSPFLYIFYPFDFERISNYRSPIVIYDLLDDISIHDDSDQRAGLAPGKRARDYHEKLLRRADIITTSSRVLFEQAVKLRPDTMLVPNGVDLSLFDFENQKHGRLPADLSGIPTPRIGFHGAIAEWFDAELVNKVVRACPEYQFVFVGPITNDRMNGIGNVSNCHLLGEKSPAEIPLYLSSMDVSLVPFVDNETMTGVRPLKVLESLAMRRPVVASPLPEIKDWPYVFPANDELQFQEGIRRALQAAKQMRGDSNLAQFLQVNSWSEAVKPLLFRMNRLLLRRTKAN